MIKQLWTQCLDLLYPRVCVACGREAGADRHHLCWDCLAGVAYVAHPFCAICGDPVDGRIDAAYTCYTCTDKRPHFDLARSAARYRGALQDVLRRFKYSGALWARRDLVDILHACVTAHYAERAIEVVAFVPLYPSRRRRRSYNQAELLAEGLARRLGRPLARNALWRIRPTGTQTNLTASARAANVNHAFIAGSVRSVQDKHILLIDDVMTTGATVNDCARALKEAGARVVDVATVARG